MFYTQIYRPVLMNLIQNVIRRQLGSVFCSRKVYLNEINYKNCMVISSLHTSSQFYAKGKDKKKEKNKKKIEVNETQLAEVIDLESLKSHMKKCLDSLKDDFIKHLSLRSTSGAIESLQISLDGKEYNLQELAQIVRKNPNTVILNLAVFPQAIPAVVKALSKSGMNLNPQQDGTTLYIPVPKVTKEHRETLAKNAKAMFIKCKDHIRETQIKFSKNVERKENLGSDLIHSVQEQIVVIADKNISEAEKIFTSKQNELLGKEEK